MTRTRSKCTDYVNDHYSMTNLAISELGHWHMDIWYILLSAASVFELKQSLQRFQQAVGRAVAGIRRGAIPAAGGASWPPGGRRIGRFRAASVRRARAAGRRAAPARPTCDVFQAFAEAGDHGAGRAVPRLGDERGEFPRRRFARRRAVPCSRSARLRSQASVRSSIP